MSETHEPTWLTQAAYDRLAAELEYLLTVARQDIAKKIQEAREEGDLKENGGYHAAKEEQGKIEARAARLENILANAVVGEARESHGVVEQGTVVRLTMNMAGIILTAAGLGFLGLGAQPPIPEWGAMISAGRRYMLECWWLVAMPGAAIMLVSLAFNLFGDGMRDVLDPRSE